MQAERSGRSDTPPRINGWREAHTPNGGSSSCSSSSSSSPSSVPPGSFIEHRVSKLDTLAGVAIMYGVEVADIKRMNGLVTDLQMFAHETLQIPLPGRHPPSPILSNGSAPTNTKGHTSHLPQNDILNSFQSLRLKPPRKVSPAMSNLQGYYGLTPPKKGPITEGTEMAVYRTGRALYLEDEPLPRESPVSDPLSSRHRKSRSLVNGFSENGKPNDCVSVIEAGESSETERLNSEMSVRRRQKADTELPLHAPVLLLKEENSGGLLGRTGKGLALRPKSGSRTDVDVGGQRSTSTGDSSFVDGFFSVRKSSSTSNLQDSESGSSIWPSTIWTLKTDALARPIFDGLPKPITVRRNKAALD